MESGDRVFKRDFFLQPTLLVSRQLLGHLLIRRFADGVVARCRIVETETYTRDDPACHAFRGQTVSNAAMFGPPGHAYIHINYGLYYCLNVVTAEVGIAEAVLIRAVEPLENAARMYRNRFGEDSDEMTARQTKGISAGPGRLGRALEIDRRLTGVDMTSTDSPVYLVQGEAVSDEDVVTTTRIGITRGADYPWRFYVHSSRFISKR